MSARYWELVGRFKELLDAEKVDVPVLRQLAWENGIPDDANVRCLAWMTLLGYLPPLRNQWDEVLAVARRGYKDFCNEVIIKREMLVNESEEDHPLSQSKGSRWKTYFEDSEIMEQIQRDIVRTHPDIHFFCSGSVDETLEASKANPVHAAMSRALFVFAKLNPGIRYVQGMNEIYAPLFYTFKTCKDKRFEDDAEADAFNCFVMLISEFRDHFCKQLDHTEGGIRANISRMNKLLEKHDRKLSLHMSAIKLEPHYYSFRWITLLFTQEFTFPDTLRLWDSIISEERSRMDFVLQICVAMLITIRDQLLEGDFATNLKLLQKYPPVDINIVLKQVALLRKNAAVKLTHVKTEKSEFVLEA